MTSMQYKEVSNKIRRHIANMHSKANASHIGSSFSCVDILTTLYFSVMKIDAKNPAWCGRDRFILSKGHAASALYATLVERGLLSKNALNKYCCQDNSLPGHVTKGCVSFLETSTGSLGHGLPIGAGMALAGKYDGLKYRVFVLMSDGECDEGSVWESALFSAHHGLNNLIAIIDYNKIQAMGRTNEVLNLEPFADKWRSFGWAVKEVDGHNHSAIMKVLKKAPFKKNTPSIIIAHTIKGKGVSFMENKLLWHYKSPDDSELKNALKELTI